MRNSESISTKFASQILKCDSPAGITSAPVQGQTEAAWEFYLTSDQGYPVGVFYNAGLADILAPPRLGMVLEIDISLRSRRVDGFPTPEEEQRLLDLEDAIGASLGQTSDHFLGRVTTKWHRVFYLLVEEDGEVKGTTMDGLAEEQGLSAEFRLARDPTLAAYWTLLTPDPDEWRGMQDERVLRALSEAGDVASKSRDVDHWAYFDNRAAAESLGTWLGENGFRLITVEDLTAPRSFRVKASHVGTMIPDDLKSRTLAMARQTRALGGTYDGWETSVMRGD